VLAAMCGQIDPLPKSVSAAFQTDDGALTSDLRRVPVFAATSQKTINPTKPATP
jgi:hypothetical protein